MTQVQKYKTFNSD